MAGSDGPKNLITVLRNGSLLATGEVGVSCEGSELARLRRVLLCRCGASRTSPMCDGRHGAAGFRDEGEVNERGTPVASKEGPLLVNARPDGPLVVEGPLTIANAKQEPVWTGERCVLCRCGASQNKPFCDGSHRSVGFRTEVG